MKIEDIISHLDKFNKTTDVTKYHENIWDVIMNISETTDLISEYIDDVGTDLNKKQIKEIMLEIYEEAKEADDNI